MGVEENHSHINNHIKRSGNTTASAATKKKEVRRFVNRFIRITKFVVLKTKWFNVCKFIILPIITGLYTLYYKVILLPKTFYLSLFLYNVSMVAITAGYHRYWTHKSYSLDSKNDFLPIFFTLFGSSVGLESSEEFISLHKLHHKFCNTDKDPHNYRKNFVWAHIGWRIMKNRKVIKLLENESMNKEEKKNKESVEDLEEKSITRYVKLQSENNFVLYILVGILLPGLIAKYFWNDLKGGIIYSGILKSFLAQQSVFSIDSLGHLLGSQPFEDKKTPRDSLIVSIITFGEGYNNFHHSFPNDYRNGVYYYRYDPTKWFLNFCSYWKVITGIKSLHCTNYDIIKRSALLHQQILIDRHRAKLNWGVPVNKLPLLTVDEFKRLAKSSGRALVIISGMVHDVTPFIHNHPGGEALIKASIGKDATLAFNGAVYNHSNAANNLLATMRIALIRDENTNNVIRENRKQQQGSTIMSVTPLDTADAA